MEPAEQGMEKLTLTTPESASTTATDALATPAGYRQLTKAILTPEQLVFFQTSKTHQTIISFIETLNDSVTGVKLSDECEQSNVRDSSTLCRSTVIILSSVWDTGSKGNNSHPREGGAGRSGHTPCREQGFTIRKSRVPNIL